MAIGVPVIINDEPSQTADLSVFPFADPNDLMFFESVANAVRISRGLLPGDEVTISASTAKRRDLIRWRKLVDDYWIRLEMGISVRQADLRDATTKVQQTARHYTDLLASLGLRGRDVGSKRAHFLNGLAGHKDADNEWADLLDD